MRKKQEEEKNNKTMTTTVSSSSAQQEQEDLEFSINEAESLWIDTFSALDSKVWRGGIHYSSCIHLLSQCLHYTCVGISNDIFRKQSSSGWTPLFIQSPDEHYDGHFDTKCRRGIGLGDDGEYPSAGGHFALGGNAGCGIWRGR